mmetsp:Transcript_31575/g.42765  ORF Transcript_31575/g.42765 Transcript_31575/m.42765 type:complete len:464 (-) Transcript_31575:478-1869(-)
MVVCPGDRKFSLAVLWIAVVTVTFCPAAGFLPVGHFIGWDAAIRLTSKSIQRSRVTDFRVQSLPNDQAGGDLGLTLDSGLSDESDQHVADRSKRQRTKEYIKRRRDQDVMLYPSFASRDCEDPTKWNINVSGWIFRPRVRSTKRAATVYALTQALKVALHSPEHRIFQFRTKYFMVQNRKGKSVPLLLPDDDEFHDWAATPLRSPVSNHFGRFSGSIAKKEYALPIQVRNLAADAPPRRLTCLTGYEGGSGNRSESSIYFVPEQGWSVISDIDDTVKVTGVSDGEEMIANTLFREYRAVDGMVNLYQAWADQGAAFHYVSCSPWQLQPYLQDFFERIGLPGGSFHLRNFKIRSKMALKLFRPSAKFKPACIQDIMDQFPMRKFILVGDSSEKDPLIYSKLFRENPGQVVHLYIRNVPNANDFDTSQAFVGVPADCWTVFTDPSEILEDEQHRNLQLLAPLAHA